MSSMKIEIDKPKRIRFLVIFPEDLHNKLLLLKPKAQDRNTFIVDLVERWVLEAELHESEKYNREFKKRIDAEIAKLKD